MSDIVDIIIDHLVKRVADRVYNDIAPINRSLHSLHEKVDTMADALVGIAADEVSLAASVPALVSPLTAAQAAAASAAAALAAQIALGTPVNPSELASIQAGLDTAAAQATAAFPGRNTPPPPVPGRGA